jgi:hypothetical protein
VFSWFFPRSIDAASPLVTPVLMTVVAAIAPLDSIVPMDGRRLVHHRALSHGVRAPDDDPTLDERLRLADVVDPVRPVPVLPGVPDEVDVAPLVVLARINFDARRHVLRSDYGIGPGFRVAACHTGAQGQDCEPQGDEQTSIA